jgi:hypothetical protein
VSADDLTLEKVSYREWLRIVGRSGGVGVFGCAEEEPRGEGKRESYTGRGY